MQSDRERNRKWRETERRKELEGNGCFSPLVQQVTLPASAYEEEKDRKREKSDRKRKREKRWGKGRDGATEELMSVFLTGLLSHSLFSFSFACTIDRKTGDGSTAAQKKLLSCCTWCRGIKAGDQGGALSGKGRGKKTPSRDRGRVSETAERERREREETAERDSAQRQRTETQRQRTERAQIQRRERDKEMYCVY